MTWLCKGCAQTFAGIRAASDHATPTHFVLRAEVAAAESAAAAAKAKK